MIVHIVINANATYMSCVEISTAYWCLPQNGDDTFSTYDDVDTI